MRTLALTTPLQHGDDVERAQARLRGNNILRQNFTPGALDGVFGPASARAAKRAKYWLGFPDRDLKPIYGDELDRYLSGAKKINALMVMRRKRRLGTLTATPLREKALANLRRHLGEKEHPAGTNRCYASTWFGLIGPWCAMACLEAYDHAGSKTFNRENGHAHTWAYVPAIVADARLGRNGLAITNAPKPGDLVCYDWNHDGVADHVGLFVKWLDQDYLIAVEGNTGIGNDSNGGEVMERGSRHDRHRADVIAFVHVGG